MRYHNITKDDMLNGDGLRAVLWVAGCTHKCKGCHNPVTWDIEGGIPFDDADLENIHDDSIVFFAENGAPFATSNQYNIYIVYILFIIMLIGLMVLIVVI